MATLTMPASPPGFTHSRFGLKSNSQTFTSPLNQSVQTIELTGARWIAVYTLPPMSKAQLALWRAFLVQCRGQSGRFFGFDPDRKTPLGIGTGTPLVNGASQTGASLITDGWTATQTGIMKAGDYFGVNGELHMVVIDANSNGAGQATLTFEPPLRTSPSDNAPITVTNPTCTMMLVDDGQAAWDFGLFSSDPLTFSGIETFT